MEFILKHEEFAELRDTPEMPESICPCHDDAVSLIMTYIDQVSLEPKIIIIWPLSEK